MKYKTMLKRYAAKTKGRVKDRMMLIIKIKRDGMDIREAAKSLGKSGSWGYKWYAKHVQAGFNNLDEQMHTGRPPKVDRAAMKKIRKNACKKLVRIGREMQDHPEECRDEILHHTRPLPANSGVTPKRFQSGHIRS